MKKNLVGIIVLVGIIIIGGYFISARRSYDPGPVDQNTEVSTSTKQQGAAEQVDDTKTVIGTSAEKRNITAYHYGTGDAELLFVGGIHGGYEWNTTSVAYELMDYLEANPNSIPKNLKITVIPVLNPDGLNKVVKTDGRFAKEDITASTDLLVDGRFNANGVDLNRNFDCDWQPKGVWQKTTVSGGSQVFSEPESQAIKAYIDTKKPTAAVVWYSAAGGVFASSCHNGVSAETKALTDTFAKASGYKAYESFDFYETTGDMVNWLAKNNIPAISVILTNHTDTEWNKNRAGVDALLKFYTK